MSKLNKKNIIPHIIGTWFFSGYLPISGTWGSFAALPFAYAFVKIGGWPLLLAATFFFFLLGCWSAYIIEENTKKKDPGIIVIDEVIGQWITLLPAFMIFGEFLPLWICFTGFILFRIFDILKPWPASYADQKIKNGFGVMIDDVFAGIYAAVNLLIIIYYFSL